MAFRLAIMTNLKTGERSVTLVGSDPRIDAAREMQRASGATNFNDPRFLSGLEAERIARAAIRAELALAIDKLKASIALPAPRVPPNE